MYQKILQLAGFFSAMLAISMLVPKVAGAGNNPFGLTYQGAVMENRKGEVNVHPVTYLLNGLKIAANVFTSANYDPQKNIRRLWSLIPMAA